MLTPEENELLTKVTDGAPMERIMRSHWVPICLTEELPENDGTPSYRGVRLPVRGFP